MADEWCFVATRGALAEAVSPCSAARDSSRGLFSEELRREGKGDWRNPFVAVTTDQERPLSHVHFFTAKSLVNIKSRWYAVEKKGNSILKYPFHSVLSSDFVKWGR